MKLALVCTIGAIALAGCTPAQRSPDSIRKDTAKATAEVTRDTKAAVQGVFDGLKQKGPININKASAADLETLPGIDAAKADKIIGGRPYDSSDQLVKKKILGHLEYERIAEHVTAH